MDVMWLDCKQATHIGDTKTIVQSSIFINLKAGDDLWIVFVHFGESDYIGFEEIIRLVSQSIFTFNKFRENADDLRIE